MPYRGDALADLLSTDPIDRFRRRATRKVGQDLQRRVRRHTPVAKALKGESREDFALRRRRRPGTLRDSWKVGEVTVIMDGSRTSIEVYTEDPIAPHVEWSTRPHLIVPKKPGGVLAFEGEGGTVFAKVVRHPGTQGVHMMATAVAEVAVEWRRIAGEEWASTARSFWRGGGPE